MNNSEIKLVKLMDVIRKDSGVNNAVDAMEQLSLILLLQYFYNAILVGSSKINPANDFESLFFKKNKFHVKEIDENFSKLKKIFHDIVFGMNLGADECLLISLKKVNSLLNAIPFRMRSEKILDVVIRELNAIDFDEDLAVAYDTLVVKMIDDSISSGVFHSPKALVSAIVSVVQPSPGDSIYDPALGTGRFAIDAYKSASESSKSVSERVFEMYGQDISPFASLVGTVNLLLNNINVEHITLGNSLLDCDEKLHDIVLSGVPFGKLSDVDGYESKYNGYASSLETMFLKHTMRKLVDGGKAALIVPDGILFNKDSHFIDLRRELLTQFNLHTILRLPSGTLAPYTNMKASVIFFDSTAPLKDIWFYDLKVEKPLNKTNKILDDAFAEFVDLFSSRVKTAQSYLVDKKEILNEEYLNLSIGLPSKSDELNRISIHDELALIEKIKINSDILYSQLIKSLAEAECGESIVKITIKELFKIKSGKPLIKSEFRDNGEFPVYGGNGIIGHYHKCNLDGENILIGRVGAQCGNVHFVKGPIWFTSNAFCVQVNSSSRIFMPYMAHALRSLKLNRLARGTAQPSISYASIKDVKLALPEYKKQIEMSAVFDEIQSKNTELQVSLKLQIEKLNELTNYSININCI